MTSAKSPPIPQPAKPRPHITAWLERVWRSARQALEIDAQHPGALEREPATPDVKRAGGFAYATVGTDGPASLAAHVARASYAKGAGGQLVLELELGLPVPRSIRSLPKLRKYAEELHTRLQETVPDLKLRDFPNQNVEDDGLTVQRPSIADAWDGKSVSLCALLPLPTDPTKFPAAEELGRAVGVKAKPLFQAAAKALLTVSRAAKAEHRRKERTERLRVVLDRFHAALGPELAVLKADLGCRGKPKFNAGDDDRDWELAWLACGGPQDDSVAVTLCADAGTWSIDPEDEDGDRAASKGEALEIDVAISMSPDEPATGAALASVWAERIHAALPTLAPSAADLVVGYPNREHVRGSRPFLWTPVVKMNDMERAVVVCLRSDGRDAIAPDDVAGLVEALLPAWPAFRSVVDAVRAAVTDAPERATRESAISLLGEAAFVLHARDAQDLHWEGALASHDVRVDGALIEVKAAVEVLPPTPSFTLRELALGAARPDAWHVARVALPGDEFELVWQMIHKHGTGQRRGACGPVDAADRLPRVVEHLTFAFGMQQLAPDDSAELERLLEELLARARHDVVRAPFTDQWSGLAGSLGLLCGPTRLLIRPRSP